MFAYKSIKIKEETWNTLRELQGKRETYDDLVSRLIKVYVGLLSLIDAQRLEGNDDC